MAFPNTPKDFERVKPNFHGSLCDEIAKLGQFDFLLAAFLQFITDGCSFTEEFKAELCDNDCEATTTTTTVCIFDETTTTTSTTTECVPLDPPVLTLDSAAENNVQLSWTNVTGVFQWRIYRNVNGGSYVLYETEIAGNLDYTDTDAPAGSDYGYKVQACNESCGCSGDSNVVTAEL